MNFYLPIVRLQSSTYTPLFERGYNLLNKRLQYLLLYTLLKLFAAGCGLIDSLILKHCDLRRDLTWCSLYTFAQLLNILYYTKQRKVLSNPEKVELIAQVLGQRQDDASEQRLTREEIENMVQSIKNQLSYLDRRLQVMGWCLPYLYSEIRLCHHNCQSNFGISVYLHSGESKIQARELLLLQGKLRRLHAEYFDVALLAVAHRVLDRVPYRTRCYNCHSVKNEDIILCYRLFGFWIIFQKIRNVWMRYNQRRKILNMPIHQFKGVSDTFIKGETECRICMQDYSENDLIMMLPCNELHHFHNSCLREWLKISQACPLCRQIVIE